MQAHHDAADAEFAPKLVTAGESLSPSPRKFPEHQIGSKLAQPPVESCGKFRLRHHEITLNLTRYALTQQDFSNYIARMDAELSSLEDKIRQATNLCRQLRDENRQLRQQMAELESNRRILEEKIETARGRLEGLLQRIPD